MEEPAADAAATIEVLVNDVSVSGPFVARLRRGHVWVPVREVVEAMGGSCRLSIAARTMVIQMGGRKSTLELNDPKRAVLLGSTPMAQAEALAALVGANFEWDREGSRVLLRGQPASAPAPQKRGGAEGAANISDLTLAELSGEALPLSRLRGHRSVLFVWAPWSESRDRLPQWQTFFDRHRNTGMRLLAVAVDATGGERSQPYVDRARLGPRAALDGRHLLGERLGFSSLPRTLLVDEDGFAKEAGDDERRLAQWVEGGRRSRRAKTPKGDVSPRESLQVIEKRLRADANNPALRLQFADALAAAGEWERAVRQYRRAAEASSPSPLALYRLGVALLKQGKSRQAAARWRQALKIEPGHEIIKKQLWALENPDRFYQGEIDLDWQRRQDRPRRRRGKPE